MFRNGLINLIAELFWYLIEKLMIIAMKVQRMAERTESEIVFNAIEKNCSSKKPVLNFRDQFKISIIGKTKPINIGIKHTRKHPNDPNETSLLTGVGLKFDEMVEKLAFFLEVRSITRQKVMNINSIEASCIAVAKSYIPYHVLKIPVVNVETAKWSTAPKSDKVSIATIMVPAINAGLTMGKASFKKINGWDKPKVLPTSNIDLDWLRNAARQIKYTYGYRVNEKTIIAPKIFLIFGKNTSFCCKLNIERAISFIVPYESNNPVKV